MVIDTGMAYMLFDSRSNAASHWTTAASLMAFWLTSLHSPIFYWSTTSFMKSFLISLCKAEHVLLVPHWLLLVTSGIAFNTMVPCPIQCTHRDFICAYLVPKLAHPGCTIKFCWMEFYILNIWIMSFFSLSFVNQLCLSVILSTPLLDMFLAVENTRANFSAVGGILTFNSS